MGKSLKRRLGKTIALAHAAFEEIALVGALMEAFRDREEYLNRGEALSSTISLYFMGKAKPESQSPKRRPTTMRDLTRSLLGKLFPIDITS